METTELRHFLRSKMGYYDHVKADEFCLKLSKSRLKIFDYSKETRVALYRFSILTITYLALECGKNDFTFDGFFKLLHSEITDENFKTDKFTTFDCVIENSLEHNSTLYFMNEYYQNYLEFMPDNAFKFYLEAFDSVSQIYNIDYNKDFISLLWEDLNNREKEKNER